MIAAHEAAAGLIGLSLPPIGPQYRVYVPFAAGLFAQNSYVLGARFPELLDAAFGIAAENKAKLLLRFFNNPHEVALLSLAYCPLQVLRIDFDAPRMGYVPRQNESCHRHFPFHFNST